MASGVSKFANDYFHVGSKYIKFSHLKELHQRIKDSFIQLQIIGNLWETERNNAHKKTNIFYVLQQFYSIISDYKILYNQ